MADEAAATATEPTATPEAAPAPERGAPQSVKESLAAQFERIAAGAGGLSDDTSRADPEASPDEKKPELEEAPDEETTKPEPKAKPKPKRVEKPGTAEPPPNELEAMRQNATRLGFVVEDGRVTTKERVQFREAQRQAATERAEQEQALLARVQEQIGAAQPKIERAEKIEAAISAGDWDGIASLLGFKATAAVGDKPGMSAWDALIQDQVDRRADPNYQRLRALEQAHAERAARDEQAAREAQARQEEHARIQARQAYVADLSATMKASKDPLLAAFHDDPAVVNAIFAIQQQEYRDTGAAPTPEQASRMKLRGVNETPREWLERFYKRTAPVFGAPVAPPAAAAPPPPAPKLPAPKTAPVPKPAPARREKWATDQAWRQDAARRMEEAFAEEEREKRRARA